MTDKEINSIVEGVLARFDKTFKWIPDHSEDLDEETFLEMKNFIWFELRQLLIKNKK